MPKWRKEKSYLQHGQEDKPKKNIGKQNSLAIGNEINNKMEIHIKGETDLRVLTLPSHEGESSEMIV